MTRPTTCAIVMAMGLLSSADLISGGQAPVPAQDAREAPRFRVGVDAVRIDAVVTDRNGRIIADLTADDFEVRQDGKLQKVTFVEFMPVLAGPAPADVSPAASKPEVPVVSPPTPLRREDVQRTVAASSTIWDSPLKAFRTRSERSTCSSTASYGRPILIALARTGGAGGWLQPFTTHRAMVSRRSSR